VAGEIEARDAAARRTWDTDMRREVAPFDREDAIIRFGNKGSSEIERELMR
jgi:tartrate dehydratase beta subunit/fumarate hydratase class I family protein